MSAIAGNSLTVGHATGATRLPPQALWALKLGPPCNSGLSRRPRAAPAVAAAPVLEAEVNRIPSSTSSAALVSGCAASVLGSLGAGRRAGRRQCHATVRWAASAAWQTARSTAATQDEALKEVVRSWRESMRQDFGKGQEVPQPRFALVFVPAIWVKDLSRIVEELVSELRWPKFAPCVGVLSETTSLTLCTAVASGDGTTNARPPRVFFLGRQELDQVSVLSLNPELRSTNTMRVNGTVLAAHAYLQRDPQDVGSLLLFADLADGMRVVNRALSVLDVAYPNATKAGLVLTRVGNDASIAVSFNGRVTTKEGGVLGLALPGLLHSSIGFCGCRPIGMPMEVHSADLHGVPFIRTVGAGAWDTDSWGVPGVVESKETSMPPRRQSMPAAVALERVADATGFTDKEDFWIGVPRGFKYDAKTFRRAPGAGEWSLYKWSATTAEGTIVLEGEGPEGDGLGKKGVHRIQGFVSEADFNAVGRLARTYELERLTREPPGTALATLVMAGGPGPKASIADEGLFDGCAVGLGVIGCAGVTIGLPGLEGTGAFSYSVATLRPTVVHRQTAGLLYFRC